MIKNTAGQSFTVVAFNAAGRVSGDAANITCTLAVDGGSRSATNDANPTEIGSSGVYVFTLTQAETNGHELSFVPSSSTSGVQILGTPSNVIFTQSVSESALSGPNAITVTVTDSDTEDPIEAAVVRFYRTGATGTQTTDEDGETVFGLATATWSWIAKAEGYSSKTGTLVVDADAPYSIELEPIVLPVVDDPQIADLVVQCLDVDKTPEAGVTVYLRMYRVPPNAPGYAFDIEPQQEVSDAEGYVYFKIAKFATYDMRRGGDARRWTRFTATGDDQQTAVSIIG